MQARVLGVVDDAHAAAAEDSANAIRADDCAFSRNVGRVGVGFERRRCLPAHRRSWRFVEKVAGVVVRGEQRQHFVLNVVGLGRWRRRTPRARQVAARARHRTARRRGPSGRSSISARARASATRARASSRA